MHRYTRILILATLAALAGCSGFSAELGSVPDGAIAQDLPKTPLLPPDVGVHTPDVEPHPPDVLPGDQGADLGQPDFLQPDATSPGPVVATLAGSGAIGHVNGPVATARFSEPRGVAVDSQGKVYVADTGNHCIRVIHNGQVSTHAGSLVRGSQDGAALVARFAGPRGVAVDSLGNLYVADTSNHLIRIVEAGQVTTVAGSSMGLKDGPASQARFRYPYDLVVDSSNMVYVADHGNHAVRVIQAGQVATVAGNGWPGNHDGPVASATFFYPGSVAIDAAGDLFVSDTGNNRIRYISAGQVSTVSGGFYGFQDGAKATARYRYPTGMATLGNDLYVADYNNHRVRRMSGAVVVTWAGQGTPNFSDGHHSVAMFNHPYNLAVDGKGRVYVADTTNNRIRVIYP